MTPNRGPGVVHNIQHQKPGVPFLQDVDRPQALHAALLIPVCLCKRPGKVLSACELTFQAAYAAIEQGEALGKTLLVGKAHAIQVGRVLDARFAGTTSANAVAMWDRHHPSALSRNPTWNSKTVVGLGRGKELASPF